MAVLVTGNGFQTLNTKAMDTTAKILNPHSVAHILLEPSDQRHHYQQASQVSFGRGIKYETSSSAKH